MYLLWEGTGPWTEINVFERTNKAYECMTKGKGYLVGSPEEAVIEAYSRGETDEFINPTIIDSGGNTRIMQGDGGCLFLTLDLTGQDSSPMLL